MSSKLLVAVCCTFLAQIVALVVGASVPAQASGWRASSAASIPGNAVVHIEAPRLKPDATPDGPLRPLPAVPPVDNPDTAGPLLTPGIRPPRLDKVPAPGDRMPGQRVEPKIDPNPPAPQRAEPSPKHRGKHPPAQGEARKTPGISPPGSKSATRPGLKSGPKIGAKKDKPGLAVAQPRTAAERDQALSDLYALLATAETAEQAQTISDSIERLWVTSGSDTINYLMQRALLAANANKPDLALQLLDAVVALAPDYAEGWNRRAYVHFSQNHIDLALGDVRRTLALDPNHFKALDGLAHILQEIGRKKEALQAARRLLEINPFYQGAKQEVDELSREIEDRGI